MSVPGNHDSECPDPACLAEAATWRVRLAERGEVDAEFERWLDRDPRHAAAWRQVNVPWQLLGEQAAMPELLALREEALGHAREARWSRAPGNGAGRPFRAWPAVAAVVLLALAAGLFVLLDQQSDVYRTGPGERRAITLADSSEVFLDARSEVRVTYAGRMRRVELLRGQAHFSVSHDPARPFTVHALGQQVRALGTEFNVDLLESTLAVTLISGRVKVRPDAAPASTGVEMLPGQQLLMATDELPVLRDASADLATAWEKGQLVFENERLDAVVARFNRYNVRQRRLEGNDVADLRISGVFREQDVDGFVATVTAYLDLDAVPGADGGILVRARPLP